ncbi:hypothetical protein RGI145_19600 [Roseomonas gilardii]|uniref:Uncharacterized protein n=1 Tax=Roseomonas gilardii TaxID=257708 RepID=A0A1L7ALA0_9PROT|nr:hypothetical protein [Roseomonas gilardii]APT59553.1 hypothetical protein RGI145_19600 [Roseomonas gilardii]
MVAIVTADMVLVESYSGGTGALEVGSTVAGFLAPGSQIASGARAVWRCTSADHSQWEEFVGTYSAGSPNTVSRDALLLRSDSGSGFINWTSGQKKLLFPVIPSRYLPLLDTDGRVPLANMPLTVNLQAADWNGNFGLSTTAAEFVAIGAPSGARLLEIEASARLESGSTTACTATMLARVYDAADAAVVAEYTLGQATLHASNAHYVTFSGRAEHVFASPIPQQQIVRWLAMIDQPVSPISIYQLRGKIRAHLQA